VSVIGFVLLTPPCLMTVRCGVNLAHHMQKRQMEIALSAYLIFIGPRFAVSL